MKNLLRSILGMLVIIVCLKVIILLVLLCYFGFFYTPEANPIDNIEDKIEQVEKKDRVLTDNEKVLEQKSTEKEWEEIDKDTDK